MFFRLVKEQMSSGRSQETLDSVGLQTPSEAGTSVHGEETAEGKYFDGDTKRNIVCIQLYSGLYFYNISGYKFLRYIFLRIFMATYVLKNSSLNRQKT